MMTFCAYIVRVTTRILAKFCLIACRDAIDTQVTILAHSKAQENVILSSDVQNVLHFHEESPAVCMYGHFEVPCVLDQARIHFGEFGFKPFLHKLERS